MTKNCFRIWALVFTFSLLSMSASAAIWTYWSLPHIVIGDNYSTTLIIRDTQGIMTRQVYVYLYDDNGDPLKANITDAGQQISDFNFPLLTSQEKSFVITSPPPMKVGWIQVVSEGPGLLSASARFTVGAQAAPTTVVGVLQTETNFDWTIAVDKRGTTDWTGIAVVNPWDTAVSFTVDFFQNGTRVPGTTTRSFNLNISGHWAKIVNEDAMFLSAWNAFTGVGTLRIRSTGGPVAAMALRGDGPAGLIYSSLPADAGTQRWDFSYTDSTAQTGTWQWQFVDGHTFVGWEVNSFNDFAVRLRGMVDSDFGQFLAEWNYSNSDTTYGVIAFIGTIALEGTTQVITGKRMQLQSDGTVISSVPFRATRVAY